MKRFHWLIIVLVFAGDAFAVKLVCDENYSLQSDVSSTPLGGEVNFTTSKYDSNGWSEDRFTGTVIAPQANGDSLEKLAYALLKNTDHILIFSDTAFEKGSAAAFQESISEVNLVGSTTIIEANIVVCPTHLKETLQSSMLLPHEGAHAFFRRITEAGVENSFSLIFLNRAELRNRESPFYHYLLSAEELYTWALDLMTRSRAQPEWKIQALFKTKNKVNIRDFVNTPLLEDMIWAYQTLINKESKFLRFAKHDLAALEKVDANTFQFNSRYKHYEFLIEPKMAVAIPNLPKYQNDPEEIKKSLTRMVDEQLALTNVALDKIKILEKKFADIRDRPFSVTLKDYQDFRKAMNDLMKEIRLKDLPRGK